MRCFPQRYALRSIAFLVKGTHRTFSKSRSRTEPKHRNQVSDYILELFSLCSQNYDEASNVFYNEHRFHIKIGLAKCGRNPDRMPDVRNIPQCQLQRMKDVQLTISEAIDLTELYRNASDQLKWVVNGLRRTKSHPPALRFLRVTLSNIQCRSPSTPISRPPTSTDEEFVLEPLGNLRSIERVSIEIFKQPGSQPSMPPFIAKLLHCMTSKEKVQLKRIDYESNYELDQRTGKTKFTGFHEKSSKRLS